MTAIQGGSRSTNTIINSSNTVATTNNNSENNGSGTARLFVGQLNFDATEHDLRQIFSFYGHVIHTNVLRGPDGKSTGSGFVTYCTTDEADFAIMSMHDRYNMGRDKPLQVSYCRRSDSISPFGYEHAMKLREKNVTNPPPPQPTVS